MNKNTLEGNWTEIKGKIKATWGRLTDDDIETVKGDLQKLSGTIQKTYGYAQDRAESEYANFKTMLSNSKAQTTDTTEPKKTIK